MEDTLKAFKSATNIPLLIGYLKITLKDLGYSKKEIDTIEINLRLKIEMESPDSAIQAYFHS